MSNIEQKINDYYSIESYHVIHWTALPQNIQDLVRHNVDFTNDSLSRVWINCLRNEELVKFFTELLPEDTRYFILDVCW